MHSPRLHGAHEQEEGTLQYTGDGGGGSTGAGLALRNGDGYGWRDCARNGGGREPRIAMAPREASIVVSAPDPKE